MEKSCCFSQSAAVHRSAAETKTPVFGVTLSSTSLLAAQMTYSEAQRWHVSPRFIQSSSVTLQMAAPVSCSTSLVQGDRSYLLSPEDEFVFTSLSSLFLLPRSTQGYFCGLIKMASAVILHTQLELSRQMSVKPASGNVWFTV